MAKRRARSSKFFKLPPELRTAVYDLVLAGPRLSLRLPLSRPPLLTVCKQITSEATSIFCSNNDFYVKLTTADITTFSRSLKAFTAGGGKSILNFVVSPDVEREADVQRTSKYGGGVVMNYQHWWWSEVPRAITGAGIRPEAVIVVKPLAWAWASDLASYAGCWVEHMRDQLPRSRSDH